MPAHFIMLFILPWLCVLGIFCFFILGIINPMWFIILIIISPILIFEKIRIFLLSLIQSQIALILALIKISRHKSTLYIDTISSTRM